MGTRGFFPGGKWPGREADHSTLSSAEVKIEWSYTSSPQVTFLAWCSVKAETTSAFNWDIGLYLHRTTQHRETQTHIHAPSRIRTRISTSERPKTVRASDRSAIETGWYTHTHTHPRNCWKEQIVLGSKYANWNHSMYCEGRKTGIYIRGCIQKFPDWVVDNEINNSNKHSLRSNTKGYGGKIY
jgi:hypothetical protein